MLSSAPLPHPIASNDFRESTADHAFGASRLPADHDKHLLASRHQADPHQAAIRQIAAILLGDDHDLSDLASTFKALGDLGYSVTAPKWEGLYFKTISGIPKADAAREAVARDMWQNMYCEPDLKQRSDLVRILLHFPFDEVFTEGPGIESSREPKASPRKIAIQAHTPYKAKHAAPAPKAPTIEPLSFTDEPSSEPDSTPPSPRRSGARESCAEEQLPVEALLYLKQQEIKKLAEILVPGILNSSDPGKLFEVLAANVATTTSSMWRKIYLKGAGFGALQVELREAIERGILTALCSRVANVSAVAEQELSKVDWNVLYADCGGSVTETNDLSSADLMEDFRRPLESSFPSPPSDDTFFTDSRSGVRIIASARAALAARLRHERQLAMELLSRRSGYEPGVSGPSELQALDDLFRSRRQHKNVFEAIDSTGHDEDFYPSNDDKFLPTDAPGGSQEKIDILTKRADEGYDLWHDHDRSDYCLISSKVVVIAPDPVSEE